MKKIDLDKATEEIGAFMDIVTYARDIHSDLMNVEGFGSGDVEEQILVDFSAFIKHFEDEIFASIDKLNKENE